MIEFYLSWKQLKVNFIFFQEEDGKKHTFNIVSRKLILCHTNQQGDSWEIIQFECEISDSISTKFAFFFSFYSPDNRTYLFQADDEADLEA